MTLACSLNRLAAALVAGSFLSVSNLLGSGGVFLFYSMLSFASMGFVYWFVPETKGRSLEEMQGLFEGIVSVSGCRRVR